MNIDKELNALREWVDSLPQHQPGYVYNAADFTPEKARARLAAIIPAMDKLLDEEQS